MGGAAAYAMSAHPNLMVLCHALKRLGQSGTVTTVYSAVHSGKARPSELRPVLMQEATLAGIDRRAMTVRRTLEPQMQQISGSWEARLVAVQAVGNRQLGQTWLIWRDRQSLAEFCASPAIPQALVDFWRARDFHTAMAVEWSLTAEGKLPSAAWHRFWRVMGTKPAATLWHDGAQISTADSPRLPVQVLVAGRPMNLQLSVSYDIAHRRTRVLVAMPELFSGG